MYHSLLIHIIILTSTIRCTITIPIFILIITRTTRITRTILTTTTTDADEKKRFSEGRPLFSKD
jgi:hypothetical protein